MPEPAVSKCLGKARKRGVLLEPLGWVHDRLSAALQIQPSLIEQLFELDHARLHLVALALAHLTSDVTPIVALMLLKGFRKQVLNLSLGSNQPFGLDRVLHHVQPKVMAPQAYRELVELLNDSVPAKFLHHAPSITEKTITSLHHLPPALRRPAIIELLTHLDDTTRFVDGVKFLATRAGLEFATLATDLGSLDQAAQVAAKIRQIVEELPLPTPLPPTEIGKFRRLDCTAEIRDLAKTWKNCLADYIFSVDEGTAAFYLAEEMKAVCFVSRQGRMGWFLLQAKGPNNVDIDPDKLAEIHTAFEAAGIPQSSLTEAIKEIVLHYQWPGRRRGPDYEDINDIPDAFDDFAID